MTQKSKPLAIVNVSQSIKQVPPILESSVAIPENVFDILPTQGAGFRKPNFSELPNNYKTALYRSCLLYTSPSPRDRSVSRMPSSA